MFQLSVSDSIKLSSCELPRRWHAGKLGEFERFFDCGECLAKEPEIYGFLAKSLEREDILLIKHDRVWYPAVLCKGCFEKYEKMVKPAK